MKFGLAFSLWLVALATTGIGAVEEHQGDVTDSSTEVAMKSVTELLEPEAGMASTVAALEEGADMLQVAAEPSTTTSLAAAAKPLTADSSLVEAVTEAAASAARMPQDVAETVFSSVTQVPEAVEPVTEAVVLSQAILLLTQDDKMKQVDEKASADAVAPTADQERVSRYMRRYPARNQLEQGLTAKEQRLLDNELDDEAEERAIRRVQRIRIVQQIAAPETTRGQANLQRKPSQNKRKALKNRRKVPSMYTKSGKRTNLRRKNNGNGYRRRVPVGNGGNRRRQYMGQPVRGNKRRQLKAGASGNQQLRRKQQQQRLRRKKANQQRQKQLAQQEMREHEEVLMAENESNATVGDSVVPVSPKGQGNVLEVSEPEMVEIVVQRS